MCPFRCGPYCALISNTVANLNKKKIFLVLRYWSWLKLQVFFHECFFFLLFFLLYVYRWYSVNSVFVLRFLFSHSHRANQQREKSFDLCSVCPRCSWDFAVGFYIRSSHFAPLLLFSFFPLLPVYYSLRTYIHTHVWWLYDSINRFNFLTRLVFSVAWNFRKI